METTVAIETAQDNEMDIDLNSDSGKMDVDLNSDSGEMDIDLSSDLKCIGENDLDRRNAKKTTISAHRPEADVLGKADTDLLSIKIKQVTDLVEKIKSGKQHKDKIISFTSYEYKPISFTSATSLGSGSFGTVLAKTDGAGTTVVEKIIKDTATIELNEVIAPLKLLKSRFVYKMIALHFTEGKLHLIMEDAGMSIKQWMSSTWKPQLKTNAENLTLQLLSGLADFADSSFIHCDIKWENVCIHPESKQLKIIDSGSVRTTKDNRETIVTCEYLDQTALKSYCPKLGEERVIHQLNHKDDVYAAGLVVLGIFMGGQPMIKIFCKIDPSQAKEEDYRSVIDEIKKMTKDDYRTLIAGAVESHLMRELLEGLLAYDREERWTAKQAISFIKGHPDLAQATTAGGTNSACELD